MKTWVEPHKSMVLTDAFTDYSISYIERPFGANSCETALVKNGECFALEGDFRKDYEEIYDQGFDACKMFYDEMKKDFGSYAIENKKSR